MPKPESKDLPISEGALASMYEQPHASHVRTLVAQVEALRAETKKGATKDK